MSRGMGSIGGSERWMAPEIITAELLKVTAASDTYSFAMTLLEISTGEPPFVEIGNRYHIISKVPTGLRPQRPNSMFGLSTAQSDRLWSLLEDAWCGDPSQRASLEKVESSFLDIVGELS